MPWWTDRPAPPYYSYDPVTFEHVGGGLCDPSPLEPDVWLVPGHATRTTAPSTGDKTVALFDITDGRWRIEADHRGEVRWLNGGFVTIKVIGDPLKWGLPEMQVHDAQYLMPDNDEDQARIRMWINDDIHEFDDDPSYIGRQVLAAWEAKGETIRPVEQPETEPFEADPPPSEQTARIFGRLDELEALLDNAAKAG